MITITIDSVNSSEKKGTVKLAVPHITINENGVEHDAHAGDWHRQVSLLAQESIDKMIQKGLLHLHSGDFAENITTKNIDLLSLPVGTKVALGEEVVVEITQIGKHCHARCAIYYAAGDCVMPKEGVFAKVITGGIAQVGAQIKVIE